MYFVYKNDQDIIISPFRNLWVMLQKVHLKVASLFFVFISIMEMSNFWKVWSMVKVFAKIREQGHSTVYDPSHLLSIEITAGAEKIKAKF